MQRTFSLFILFNLLVITGHGQITDQSNNKGLSQRAIIQKYCLDPVKEYGFYSSEFRDEIDKGLKLDSTIAFLWEKKSEPLMKMGKYEIGMEYLDKAVQYDTIEWLAYRGFMKCIFAHQYRSAILDFEEAKKMFGNNIEMDHSYDFHIALCYLQLHQFSKSELFFENDINRLENEKDFDWVHHLDLFYLGISKYEQKKYEDAIKTFDLALSKYPEFSEAQFYKAICLKRLGRSEEYKSLKEAAIRNGKKGYTINEDNVVYVRYPYQINWEVY